MSPAKKIRWIGIDYGQCIMTPASLRNPLMFGDIAKLRGKQEEAARFIQRMRRLKEKYGTISKIKEGHKDEIESFVLDGDHEAMLIFGEKEQELLGMAPGLLEFLKWVNEHGIRPSIVSELKKTLGPVGSDMITLYLNRKGIIDHFEYFITPQGKMKLSTEEQDLRYKGTSKENGTLYDELVKDLGEQGISPEECLMIGDKWSTDIKPPKQRGWTTIQYTGHIDMGQCEEADYYAKDFYEVQDIVAKLI
ncbi:MAG: HAD family hydrolase [Gaiellales bacterium]|nr:HAD family hydrolase [Gaiellales bacterium]